MPQTHLGGKRKAISMRNALLYETAPDLALMGIWFVVSVILCAIGVRIIYKYENSYVKVV